VTTAAEIQLQETEADRVVRWRAQELERAGFAPAAAAELAERNDVDLHRAIELLESGCPAELALEILR
jgi:hypothetical protein